MNWTDPPATENQPGYDARPGRDPQSSSPAVPPPSQPAAQPQGVSAPGKPPEIKINKGFTPSLTGNTTVDMEVFTLTLGEETIDLVPLKNWSQLDHYKWTVRGKLPAEPSGLEIALDHVRIAGETVRIGDPAGCEKLERLFNEWLLLEKETLELARKKAHPVPLWAVPQPQAQHESQPPRFSVEVDKRGQVHIHCLQGKLTVASAGLTPAGFSSLCQQGLMRKPRTLETGALHDWVELDGELFSFEKGRNDAARLEQVLNERYLAVAAIGLGKQVVIFLNAASSTGFDIQFPVRIGGVPDNHRHHLNEQSLELLQDPDHCGLLHKEIIVKLIPPNLVFKKKTPDGGEQNLGWGPEHALTLTDDAGHQKILHLSQPLNLLRLSPAELTAVFNHPAINQHTKATPPPRPGSEPQPAPAVPGTDSLAQPQSAPSAPSPSQNQTLPQAGQPGLRPPEHSPLAPAPPTASQLEAARLGPKPPQQARPLPNPWMHDILAQPTLPHDWFACLVYGRMAEHFGNSTEGRFGQCACWSISLGETEDIEDPAFKGIFLTEKRSLGFLNQGQMAKFYNGIAFVGPRQSTLEGIQIRLVGVGLNAHERVVFIVSDHYRTQFDVPETTLTGVLNGLREAGAVVLGIREALASPEPIEVVWTAPAEQSDPDDPQPLESTRPEP